MKILLTSVCAAILTASLAASGELDLKLTVREAGGAARKASGVNPLGDS